MSLLQQRPRSTYLHNSMAMRLVGFEYKLATHKSYKGMLETQQHSASQLSLGIRLIRIFKRRRLTISAWTIASIRPPKAKSI
jgi:hypothetical protein